MAPFSRSVRHLTTVVRRAPHPESSKRPCVAGSVVHRLLHLLKLKKLCVGCQILFSSGASASLPGNPEPSPDRLPSAPGTSPTQSKTHRHAIVVVSLSLHTTNNKRYSRGVRAPFSSGCGKLGVDSLPNIHTTTTIQNQYPPSCLSSRDRNRRPRPLQSLSGDGHATIACFSMGSDIVLHGHDENSIFWF